MYRTPKGGGVCQYVPSVRSRGKVSRPSVPSLSNQVNGSQCVGIPRPTFERDLERTISTVEDGGI